MYQKIDLSNLEQFIDNNSKIYLIKGSRNENLFGPVWLLAKDKGKIYLVGRGSLLDSFPFSEEFFKQNKDKFYDCLNYNELLNSYKNPYILELNKVYSLPCIEKQTYELTGNFIYINC